jgi:hypothetical protein
MIALVVASCNPFVTGRPGIRTRALLSYNDFCNRIAFIG